MSGVETPEENLPTCSQTQHSPELIEPASISQQSEENALKENETNDDGKICGADGCYATPSEEGRGGISRDPTDNHAPRSGSEIKDGKSAGAPKRIRCGAIQKKVS